MIAVADAIFDEVEANVAALNGEVVRRALAGHCCNYPQNMEEFQRLLTRYVVERLDAHYWKVRWDHDWACLNYHDIHAKYVAHTYRANCIRIELRKFWPCSACIHLFNPTGRIRRPQLVC